MPLCAFLALSVLLLSSHAFASDMFQHHIFGTSQKSVGETPLLLRVLNQERLKWSHDSQVGRPKEWTAAAPSNQGPAPALSPQHHDFHGKHHKHRRKRHHSAPPPPSLTPPQDCSDYSCLDPLTQAPIGSPCGCVYPIQVMISLGVPPYQLFSQVAELEVEVAVGTYLKQSQVRIMGANPDIQDPGRTIVTIYLVPLGEKFDNMTAFLNYERFWQKKVLLNVSLFGVYDVMGVQYSGLPPSPPSIPLAYGPNRSYEYPFTAKVPTIKKRKMDPMIIAMIALSSLILVLIFFGTIYAILKCKRIGRRPAFVGSTFTPPSIKGMTSITPSNFSSSTPVSFFSNMAHCPPSVKSFSLAQLLNATERFSSKKILGEGGSGRVYTGNMEDGSKVAIKMLTRKDQNGDREFIAEVEMLSRLHHRNLVKLIGICIENNVRCLVYELIHNGSVESHLHGIDRTKGPLDWDARMKIALGSARALAYLHEDSNPHVIHRDFKASNVLLEDDYNPKVSDFGLAREASDAFHHISTQVMGTFGYVAPEYAMTGHLLVKSDVYSYGVVLLELLSGRKPVYINESQQPENLVTWARPLLSDSDGLQRLIDPALGDNYNSDDVARVAAIASMCVQAEAAQRPFMGEVVQALKLICREMEACEDSNSHPESSCGPDDDSKGFGFDDGSSCFGGSPFSAPGRPTGFMSMECGSDPMEGIGRQQHTSPSTIISRVEAISRRSRSGPLGTMKPRTAFYRLRGSVSEHGQHPSRRETIIIDGEV